MLVTFKHDIESSVLESWNESKRERYYNDVQIFVGDAAAYVVFGIVFLNYATLLVIDNFHIYLSDNDFFSLYDSSIPRSWVAIPKIQRNNIVFYDRQFENYGYVGIDKLMSEYGFFENYLNNNKMEVAYVDDMRKILLEDAILSGALSDKNGRPRTTMTLIQNAMIMCGCCRVAFEQHSAYSLHVRCPNCEAYGNVEQF